MLTISQAVPAGAASRKDQLKQDKAAAQSQLAAQESKYNNLKTRNRHFPLRSISWILIW